mgnify:CR=1 FL=1
MHPLGAFGALLEYYKVISYKVQNLHSRLTESGDFIIPVQILHDPAGSFLLLLSLILFRVFFIAALRKNNIQNNTISVASTTGDFPK